MQDRGSPAHSWRSPVTRVVDGPAPGRSRRGLFESPARAGVLAERDVLGFSGRGAWLRVGSAPRGLSDGDAGASQIA